MPLFTFRCPKCGEQREVLCKAAERDTLVEMCPGQKADLDAIDDDPWFVHADAVPMVPVGIEAPVLRVSGAYSFKAVTGAGEKLDVAHHGPKRTDW